eukprot:m.184554 g.184554  ORF g.184554 m.184554 type:complete len:285 (+) comp16169_c0_seq1:50-904(+)
MNRRAKPAAAAAAPKRHRFSNTADAGVEARQEKDAEEAGILAAITAWFEGLSKWWRSLSSTRQARALQEPPTPAATRGIDALQRAKATTYSDGTHEALLRELWQLLGTGAPYQRISPNWSDIGFQGKDPATDFRGQGLLGLQNILFVVRNHTEACRRMVQQHSAGFPFAIAVINISLYLTQLINKYPGAVGNWLFVDPAPGNPCNPLAVFNELFARVFLDFERYYDQAVKDYLAAGGNPGFVIMQFNPIKDKFNEVLERDIESGTFQTTMVAQAVQAAAGERRT